MRDKAIGIQIKKARVEAQLTQTDLGNKIGVTWEMISRYENGKSSPRKNIEKIASSLGKPIQYFFGVEEMPIGDEIKKLSTLLEKRGAEIGGVGKVPYVEFVEGFTITKALKLTKQNYQCPSWIFSQFKKAFALRLSNVSSDLILLGREDVGFFTNEIQPKVKDYVLVQQGGRYRIEKFTSSMKEKVHGVLLAIEKKYYSK